MPRFNRTYRLLAGEAGGSGVEIRPPIHITFEVDKDAKEETNVHRISIWNLKKETRDRIVEPDTFVVLYAGYEEEDGPVLVAAGNVTFGYSYIDGPNWVTELELKDGYANVRDTVVSMGYGPGARASVIIRELARQMGLHLVMSNDAPDRTWQNGFSFYGAAYKALHKVVQGTGLEWSIQNAELQVIPRRGVTPRQAVVLSSDSGLIGYPERTRRGAQEKARVKDKRSGDNKDIVSAKQQIDGWRVESLLLPQLNPGDLVKLESRTVEGWFRIEELRHTGDYGGNGGWNTELQLVDRETR